MMQMPLSLMGSVKSSFLAQSTIPAAPLRYLKLRYPIRARLNKTCACADVIRKCDIQMWPDLIQKAKDGGLDAIETYIFWNVHEPRRREV